jgi:hypothetical protein
MDKGEKGKATLQGQLAAEIRHFQERSHLGELLFHLPGAVGGTVDLFLDVSRSIRMCVTVDQANQMSFGDIRAVGIDMKLDDFSRLHRDLVRVTKDFDLCHY